MAARTCLAVKSMSALDKLATSIEPMLDKGFPPDMEHATDLIAKRREVLKKGAK